jgi:hypothetical protein
MHLDKNRQLKGESAVTTLLTRQASGIKIRTIKIAIFVNPATTTQEEKEN